MRRARPTVFIDDAQFTDLWRAGERYYIVAADTARPRLESLVGSGLLTVVAESGGKMLLTNHPLPAGR